MKKYQVAFTLQGSIDVDAESEEEARNKANNTNLAQYITETTIDWIIVV